MGYYTQYTLSIYDGDELVRQKCPTCDGNGFVSKKLLTVIGEKNKEVGYILDGESSKWYDHESDMRRISEYYPGITFKLEGEGEEAGDVWVKYFRDGKMQESKAEIKLDAFDEKALQ